MSATRKNWWQPHQYVLARSECLYRFFALTDVPKANRTAVLQLKILQWLPWQDSDTWIVTTQEGAMVWAWQNVPTAANATYIIPETLLQTQYSDGMRIIQDTSGFELQYWQASILKYSLWQRQPFDDKICRKWQEWLSLYDSSLDNVENFSIVQAIPWAFNKTKKASDIFKSAKLAIGIMTIILAGIYADWLVDWYKLKQENVRQEQHYETLLASLKPILEQRNAQELANQHLQAIHELIPSQLQLSLYKSILPALQKAKCSPCQLIEWNYDTTTLDFTITAEQLDQKTIISQLYEMNNGFKDIRITPKQTKSQWTISLAFKDMNEP